MSADSQEVDRVSRPVVLRGFNSSLLLLAVCAFVSVSIR
jgi:hypothetical protein